MLLAGHPGVYFVGDAAPVELGAETGALLSVRDGAVLSHHSAAALWKIGGGDRNVHILVEGAGAGRRAGVIVHRTRASMPTTSASATGSPCHPLTSPARTLLDNAGQTRMRVLERMFIEAVTQPLVNAPLHGFQVDFYWPAYAVVVEIDSYGFHTSRWAY